MRKRSLKTIAITNAFVLSLMLMLAAGNLWPFIDGADHAAAAPITITTGDLISGPPRGAPEGVLAWARANGAARMADLTDYVYEVYRLAPIVGIDPAIVIAQSAIETANWTSSYWVNFLNPSGIGIHYDGAPSYYWTSGANAARFQIALLYIYVNGPIPKGHILYPYLVLGPGWSGPIEEGFAGKVKRVNDLSGRWAVDLAYGMHIANRGTELYKNVAPSTSPPQQTVFNAVSNAGNDPARVLDGNLGTSWAILGNGVNPAKPGYLQLDLGAKTRLSSISWIFRATGYADRMRIRVSEDGIAYTTISTMGNAPANAWQAIALDRVARYVRFNLDNPNGDLNLGYIAEVRIYGVANEPTPTSVPKSPTPTPVPTATNVTLAASGGSKGATYTGRIRDGQLSTDWRTTSSPAPAFAYVYVDLGAVTTIASVSWVFSQTGGAPQLDIQISYDKTTWTTVASASDAPAGAWQSAAVNTDARYLRWLFTNSTTVPVLGYLAEVSVRPGAPATATPAATATSTTTPPATSTVTATATTMPAVDTSALPADAPIPIVASSDSAGSGSDTLAYDGLIETAWRSSGTAGEALQLDLGQGYALTTAGWLFNQANCVETLTVEGSLDGVTWTPLASAGPANSSVWQAATVSGSARYLRWSIANSAGIPQPGCLAEVAAWGAPDQLPPTETAVPAEEIPTETPLPPTETPTEIVPDTTTAIPTEIPVPIETPILPPEEPTEAPPETPTEAVVQG